MLFSTAAILRDSPGTSRKTTERYENQSQKETSTPPPHRLAKAVSMSVVGDRQPPAPQLGRSLLASVTKGSGCYTCRIRRKVGHLCLHYICVLTLGRVPSPQKCDGRPNAEGRCETCVRLRLQCLRFGRKRPDWLKVCVLACVARGSHVVRFLGISPYSHPFV